MWKGALQKAGIIDGTVKEKKSPPRVFVNDKVSVLPNRFFPSL
jgi:hypothetical protein